jgi:hypothetical protein
MPGQVYFAGLLSQGVPRAQVVLDIEASQEYRTLEVEQLYQSLLARGADAAGLNYFVAYLGSGHSVAEVKVLMLGSPEYFARAGGTNEAFLAALYHDVLGRGVDPTGQAGYSAIMARGFGPDVVALFVVHSLEARRDLVDGYYQEFLDRAADPSGLASFTQPRAGGYPDEMILATILGSPEYFDRFGSLSS